MSVVSTPLIRADTGLIASPSVSNYLNPQITRAGLSLMARTSHKASRHYHGDAIYQPPLDSPQSSNCTSFTYSNVWKLGLKASNKGSSGICRAFFILAV